MRRIKYIIVAAVVASFSAHSGFAQSQGSVQKDYAAMAKVSKDAEDVYKGHPEYQVPALLEQYRANESRVEVKQVPYSDSEKLPLLSSVVMKNKYNPELVRDFGANFNAVAFNPLKYMFSFYSKEEQVFRVDNTSFVIVIHPAVK